MLGRVLINRGSIEDVCFTTNSRRAAGPLKESAKCHKRTSGFSLRRNLLSRKSVVSEATTSLECCSGSA